uniref:CARD domain-containing protein n=1 Tax=Anabas testudineus TaxID=64144 RepID=A0A3Q1JCS8_ANATE
INKVKLESIQTMSRTDKARELIDLVLNKGNSACKIMIDNLCDLDPFVSETLQLKLNECF